jgi:uncharacterized surface protein with fasciclin (FAS1) repeats
VYCLNCPLNLNFSLFLAHNAKAQESHVPPETSCSTIAHIACNTDGFATLCAAVQAADLGGALTNGTFTVFAPSDEAFDALPAGTLDSLLKNKAALTNVLLFHAVADKVVMSDNLRCMALTKMANGKNSRTICQGQSVNQKGAGNSREKMPKIVTPDIEACNGVVLVSQVMLP